MRCGRGDSPAARGSDCHAMLIKIGFDIELSVSAPTALIYQLRVHPTRRDDLLAPERIEITPTLRQGEYLDAFGNQCGRVGVPAGVGKLRLRSESLIRDSGLPDPVDRHAPQHDPQDLPSATLQFLLASRYCEVDSELLTFAWDRFGHTAPGWPRVQAICDFVHRRLRFDYNAARATRTALDAFRERVGVCRDFTHLALTLCRCMNIPARYCTGYLGDIGVAPLPSPMDFSAWFEVYLGDRWHPFDARHPRPRIGRIPMARGRDAADVPITIAFGQNAMTRFQVTTCEVDGRGGYGVG